MHGLILHAQRDLRIETVPVISPGPGEVRVAVKAGGICGSDLHYYNHGGTATIRLREPMALGHEVAGIVVDVGDDVDLSVGTRVAVNPAAACGRCDHCKAGLRNHCRDTKFMGSAMRFPHVQGAFRQSITIAAGQAVPIADGTTMSAAALAEPLAVCLHAAKISGPLLGKRVLITGCGPIGALMTVCARLGGAREIVVTDLADFPLDAARRCGATATHNMSANPDALADYGMSGGYFDLCFEASGSSAALRSALPKLLPRGVIVQLGMGGDYSIPINALITREVQLLGSFRFTDEFAAAVSLIDRGDVNVSDIVTAIQPYQNHAEALEAANDRGRHLKVQLEF